MSSNKYKSHVVLIPEDDKDRQLANGFIKHHAVDDRRLDIRNPAGGWHVALKIFQVEYLDRVRENPCVHVVILIDFDNQSDRMDKCLESIPDDVRPRVFVIGSWKNPEKLTSDLKKSPEEIGKGLADECFSGVYKDWVCEELAHNAPELERMAKAMKDIVFS